MWPYVLSKKKKEGKKSVFKTDNKMRKEGQWQGYSNTHTYMRDRGSCYVLQAAFHLSLPASPLEAYTVTFGSP